MNNPYLKTLESVWENLDYVFINQEKLQALIEKMKKEELKIPAWAVPNVQPPIDCKPADWIDYICQINTVNFAFTNFEPPHNKFTIEYPQGTFWHGAFALEASFIRAYSEGIPVFDSKHMVKISLPEVRYIFRSIGSQHQIPMTRERWKIFHQIGKTLLKKFNGSWAKLFIEGDWRAFNEGKGIVEQLITNFPSFSDKRIYKGRVLEFHKRAQLLVMMYHGRAVNSGARLPEIKDIEDIGPIADYNVPKVLRFLGVLEYSPEMERAIQDHKIFYPGHPMETENRLGMSYVMKKICDELDVNMAQADSYVWHLGKESNASHILVPTTDY